MHLYTNPFYVDLETLFFHNLDFNQIPLVFQWIILFIHLLPAMSILLFPAYLFYKKNPFAIRIFLFSLADLSITTGLKWIFGDPRPLWVFPALSVPLESTHFFHIPHSFGMPSGHVAAMMVFVFYEIISKKRFPHLSFFLTMLVGLARILVGAHFISQVLASLVLGSCLIVLFIFLKKWIKLLEPPYPFHFGLWFTLSTLHGSFIFIAFLIGVNHNYPPTLLQSPLLGLKPMLQFIIVSVSIPLFIPLTYWIYHLKKVKKNKIKNSILKK